ncbi:MAG TPA: HAMP domain-containing sensor histidine kinase, partial [Solirubrobacteraceae bacterium]|nr:HAMP domain-containing sensor histidine kinase [Solirubrobacteraceae bacterium]
AAADVLAAIPASDTADGTLTIARRTVDYVTRPSLLGRVVVVGPAGTTFAEFRPFLISLLIAGAGGALLAALLAIVLARRLSRPVADLAAATRRVAAGEADVAVPVGGEDELADLGRSFNEMSFALTTARAGQRRFLESVSHELRTPLTSIRGYAEALEEGAVTPEQGACVIAAEAGRLERLVADLLELARLGRDGFTVQCADVDLAALAARALERHRPEAAQLGIELSADGTEPAPAWGDEDRLLQVVSNLIENALRLTPAGGSVSVRYGPSELAVLDTGPGLAPEDLPRAFERFYLHERYRSERAVGSGLGLAIVEELARAMGATVEARSRPGGPGAEFVVRLARRERSATPGAGRPFA